MIISIDGKIPTVDGKAIMASGGKVEATWHQCPQLVRDYLDNVAYNPSDYSTSEIADYAPATAVQSNTKPIGKTIDGVTYYNEVPNVATPFASTNKAGAVKPLDRLRWINSQTSNMRDLGGWACDGGTVKYGMLFRGGEPLSADKELALGLGIRHELQLRGTAEAPQNYSLWGVPYTCPTNYVWYTLTDTTAWHDILECVFATVNYNIPLYYHCSAGADRTATVACVLEALLGMSQSDIDKDYEMTCFSTGTATDNDARRRNEAEWKGLVNAIKAVPLASGLSDTFRNRAVSFVLSIGFSIAQINAFRAAMIDGNPEIIVVLPSVPITYKNGYTVSYTVGQAANLTANASYFATEKFEVSAGTTYTLKLTNATATSSFRFVGVNDSDVVTESQNNSYSQGDSQYTWTPANGTTHAYIRGYNGASGYFGRELTY